MIRPAATNRRRAPQPGAAVAARTVQIASMDDELWQLLRSVAVRERLTMAEALAEGMCNWAEMLGYTVPDHLQLPQETQS